MTDDLIHEVEEAIKQDELNAFWKQNGGLIIGGIILVILITAAVSGFQSWSIKTNKAQTGLVLNALKADNPAEELNRVMKELKPEHQAIAHLNAAALALKEKDNEKALAHYRALTAQSNAPKIFRDLAGIMAIKLAWETSEDNNSANEYLATLEAISSDETNLWRWHAHLQAALISAHNLEEYRRARQHLAIVITAENIPPSLTERAKALYHVYGTKASEQDTATEEPEG